jgi:hypothetical protein
VVFVVVFLDCLVAGGSSAVVGILVCLTSESSEGLAFCRVRDWAVFLAVGCFTGDLRATFRGDFGLVGTTIFIELGRNLGIVDRL